MISGSVTDLQGRVGVPFRVANQPNVEIEFVVDTGFAGALTLPAAAVAALGLPFLQEMVANLADDTTIRVDVYAANIVWNGVACEVAVLGMGKRALLGTALLPGHRLMAEFDEGGAVTIDALQS